MTRSARARRPSHRRPPHRRQRGRYALAAAVVALVLAACSGGGDAGPATPTTSGFKPVIRLAVNDWTASAIDVAIAEQLIERHLGHPVEPVREDDATTMYQDLADGRLDAVLEVWPSTITERHRRFFDRGQVVELGPLGPVGQVGWYVPRAVVEAHPELASWTALQDPAVAGLFATPTAPGGRLLGIDPSYRQFDEQIVANLGLPLTVEFSGSEANTLAALAQATSAGQPILVYWWEPTAAVATYDLVRVALPEPTDACAAAAEAGTGAVACDYPPDPLLKVASPDLAARAPDVAAFLGAFTLTTADQQELLRAVEVDGTGVADAAGAWIEANEAVWRSWLAA